MKRCLENTDTLISRNCYLRKNTCLDVLANPQGTSGWSTQLQQGANFAKARNSALVISNEIETVEGLLEDGPTPRAMRYCICARRKSTLKKRLY